MEAHDRLYAFSEHVEREILVGRVDGIAFEAEPHQYGFHAEHLFKSGNDGYATAASYGQGSFAECLLEAFLCGTIGRVRDGADVALAAMQVIHLHTDAFRCYALQMGCYQRAYFFAVLMRYEASGNLGVCLAWNDSFCSFASIAAPDAAAVECGATTVALNGAVASLAEHIGDAY